MADNAKEHKPASGIIKALIAGFPALLGSANDLIDLWQKAEPIIKGFFGMT